MFTTNLDRIKDAIASGTQVRFRQKGGITWCAVNPEHINVDIFEYWIGNDYPRQPESVFYDATTRIGNAIRGFNVNERILILSECLSVESRGLLSVDNAGNDLRRANINLRGLLQAIYDDAENVLDVKHVEMLRALISTGETGYSVHKASCPYEHGGACNCGVPRCAKCNGWGSTNVSGNVPYVCPECGGTGEAK